jgi:hypothetical protein
MIFGGFFLFMTVLWSLFLILTVFPLFFSDYFYRGDIVPYYPLRLKIVGDGGGGFKRVIKEFYRQSTEGIFVRIPDNTMYYLQRSQKTEKNSHA